MPEPRRRVGFACAVVRGTREMVDAVSAPVMFVRA
jgi:hypothetical protein